MSKLWFEHYRRHVATPVLHKLQFEGNNATCPNCVLRSTGVGELHSVLHKSQFMCRITGLAKCAQCSTSVFKLRALLR